MKIVKKKLSSLVAKDMEHYAVATIKRVVPDKSDGLKPVHRAIFLSLYNIAKDKFVPASSVVGDTRKYHEHGETSVELSTGFLANQRCTLIDVDGTQGFDGHGNLTAPRYLKYRLSKLGKLLLDDAIIDKEDTSVPFKMRIPYGLMIDQVNIAVGIGSRYPTFNGREIIQAMIEMNKNHDISTERLCEIVKGVDIRSGTTVVQYESTMRNIMEKGKGENIISLCRVSKAPGRAQRILIEDLPWQEKSDKLLLSKTWDSISGLDMNNLINGVNRKRAEITIPYRRREFEELRDEIYEKTSLKKGIGVKLSYKDGDIVDLIPMRELMLYHIKYNYTFIENEIKSELARMEHEKIIYDTLEIVTREENIDKFTPMIKYEEKVEMSIKEFDLNPVGAELLFKNNNLNMISKRPKILKYLEVYNEKYNQVKARLNEENIIQETEDYFKKVLDLIGDLPRRTKIEVVPEGFTNIEEDNIEEIISDRCYVLITKDGMIKRVNDLENINNESNIKWIVDTFTDAKVGYMFSENVYITESVEIPQYYQQISEVFGTFEEFKCPVKNVSEEYLYVYNTGRIKKVKSEDFSFRKTRRKGFKFREGEKIIGVVPSEIYKENNYLYIITKNGGIQRTSIDEHTSNIIISGGKNIIRLKDDDKVVDFITTDEEKITILTEEKEVISLEFTKDMELDPTQRPHDLGINPKIIPSGIGSNEEGLIDLSEIDLEKEIDYERVVMI